MPDRDTLLAYLVSSFPGNTENIATEALSYIFNHSDASLEACNDVVRSGVCQVNPITVVKTQMIGSDGTCPDLVGFDETGAERVLIEVKFWAELTPHQPNRYLKRLPDDGPAVVMFLVPEERVQLLWPRLKDRLRKEFGALIETDSERQSVRLKGTQKHLLIASWGGLLDSMAARTVEYDEPGVGAEIRQLRTLAKYADNGAFKPIRSGEQFGRDSEVRLRQFKRLIDAATERGISGEWASRKGLRAVTRSYGYGRYISLDGYNRAIVWFGVNLDRFAIKGDTPLWVELTPSLQKRMPGRLTEIRQELGLSNSEKWVPVNFRRGVEYPELLDGVARSLKGIAEVLQRVGGSS